MDSGTLEPYDIGDVDEGLSLLARLIARIEKNKQDLYSRSQNPPQPRPTAPLPAAQGRITPALAGAPQPTPAAEKNQPPAVQRQARRSGPAVAPKQGLLDQAFADILAQQKVMHDAEVQTQGPEISRMAETYAERYGKIKPKEVNPYGESLARFMSLLGASGLANRGNISKAFGEAMPKYYENIDKERDRSEKDADRQRQQLQTEMLFGAQDLESRNAGTKFTNEKLIRMAGITDPTKINEIRKAMVTDQRAQQQLEVQRAAANKSPFRDQVEFIAQKTKQPIDKVIHDVLTRGKEPREREFNREEVAHYTQVAKNMIAKPKDKDAADDLYRSFEREVGRDPQAAFDKFQKALKIARDAGKI